MKAGVRGIEGVEVFLAIALLRPLYYSRYRVQGGRRKTRCWGKGSHRTEGFIQACEFLLCRLHQKHLTRGDLHRYPSTAQDGYGVCLCFGGARSRRAPALERTSDLDDG